MTLGYHGPAGLDACTIYLPSAGRLVFLAIRLGPRRRTFRTRVRKTCYATSSEKHRTEAIA